MTFRTGIYFDLDEDDYHRDPALGSGDVRNLLISAPDFWWRKHHREEVETTEWFDAGKAFHKRVLEGEQSFRARFIPRPDVPRLTKKIREEHATNGQTIIDADEFERIEISAELISRNTALATAFSGGASEVSVFWCEQVNGTIVPCKARFDYLKVRGVGDLKSMRNYKDLPFHEACARAIVNYRYDIQACHYLTARACFPDFVSHDLVWGDYNPDWLKRVAQQQEYAFQFIVLQATSAPICWSKSLSWGNPILEIAARDRRKALETYVRFMSEFGPDQMWTIDADVDELDIKDMPRWYK